MKQLVAGLVMVTAFGVTLASQRGRGSAELELGTPPGAAFVNGGGNADAGSNEWVWYQRLNTDQPVPAIEEFYRPKLAALGWRVTYAKADANLALTRYSAGTAADPQVGFLTVVPLSGLKQVIVSIHLVSGSRPAPDTGRRGGGGAGFEGAMLLTARQEMDLLIHESQPPAGESFARRPDTPAAFPTDILPPRFVVDTVLTSATRTTVVGRVDNAGGSAVPALVLALQARGWHAPEEQYGLRLNAEISRPMCRGEHAAYLKFIDRPDHVLLASIRVTTTSQPCKPYEVTPNFPVPLLIVPRELTARMQDGGGSAGSDQSQVRIATMTAPDALFVAFEPQVKDAGFHLESRMGDTVQTVAKFSTAGSTVTPVPGFHASALLFLTAVPGTHEVDALLTVYRHEPPGKR